MIPVSVTQLPGSKIKFEKQTRHIIDETKQLLGKKKMSKTNFKVHRKKVRRIVEQNRSRTVSKKEEAESPVNLS